MVPGEITSGDDLEKIDGEPEWTAAVPGVEVHANDRAMYARKSDSPVDVGVLHKTIAAFSLIMIENGYRVENMVTDELLATSCKRCGGEGSVDHNLLWMQVGEMCSDGRISEDEYNELDGPGPIDSYFPRYLEICNAKGIKPNVPMEYDHSPDCEAVWFRRLLYDVGEVFENYLRSNGIDSFALAHQGWDLLLPNTGWDDDEDEDD